MSARMVQRALGIHDARSRSQTSIVSPDLGRSDSEEEHAQESGVANRFDLLGLQEDGLDDDEDEDTQRPSDQPSAVGSASTSASVPAPAKGKRKKNKGKKKGKQQPQVTAQGKSHGADDESVDEILRRLAVGNAEVSSSAPGSTSAGRSATDSFDKHLGVDTKHLRAEDELRRIFGSRVINSVESRAPGFRRRQADSRHSGRAMPVRKSMLVVPMEHWARWDGGISMECTEVKDGCQYFRYKYSSSYAEVQKKFEVCVKSHNPNTILALLRNHPYHVDSLLALAEVYKHMGEYQQSADLLEQCLYALECAWHPCFNPSLGTCRLEYKIDTNKALFLALFRHMQHLGKRGCHRTALEICKLLLSLDNKDPCGALLCIDYFALRAEQYEWLVNLVDYHGDKTIRLLPNFSYSLAVALFHMEGNKAQTSADSKTGFTGSRPKASERLQQALAIHPTVLKKIVDKAPIKEDAAWTKILNHPHFLKADAGGPTLEHLISIHVERCCLLWRAPDLQAWLKEIAASITELADSRSPEIAEWGSAREEVCQSNDNQYKHLQVSEFSDSTSTLPPEEMPQLGLLPGIEGVGGLEDDEIIEMLEEGVDIPQALQNAALHSRNALMAFLQTLVPWGNHHVVATEEGAPVLLDDSSDNNDSTAGEFGD